MAPRKPRKAGATGEDLGNLGEGWSCYLGKSLVEDSDLAELVPTGALLEGQAFYAGDHVVPSPEDGRTVVFASSFDAGLCLPCDDFLPAVLEMYEAKLPQLSPPAFVKLAVFAWMCRTSSFRPTAELFAVLFLGCRTTKNVHTPAGPKKTVFGSVNFNLWPERLDAWPVPTSMTKWDRHWMQKWFYITNPYPANNDKANRLRFRCSSISIVAKPNVEIDGTLESRLILLCKVARRLSTCDLCEEFCMLQIAPLEQDWGIGVKEDEELFALPRLILLLVPTISFIFTTPLFSLACILFRVTVPYRFPPSFAL